MFFEVALFHCGDAAQGDTRRKILAGIRSRPPSPQAPRTPRLRRLRDAAAACGDAVRDAGTGAAKTPWTAGDHTSRRRGELVATYCTQWVRLVVSGLVVFMQLSITRTRREHQRASAVRGGYGSVGSGGVAATSIGLWGRAHHGVAP